MYDVKDSQILFGHINNTLSSYIYGLTSLTTCRNSCQIHTFPLWTTYSCLLTSHDCHTAIESIFHENYRDFGTTDSAAFKSQL